MFLYKFIFNTYSIILYILLYRLKAVIVVHVLLYIKNDKIKGRYSLENRLKNNTLVIYYIAILHRYSIQKIYLDLTELI